MNIENRDTNELNVDLRQGQSQPMQTMTLKEAVSRIPQRTLPGFWLTDKKEIEKQLSGLKRGKVSKLTKSAGKRDIYFVTYGEKETMPRLANFNSAIAAKEPEVFCNKKSRKKPVIYFIGPIHGAEVEGLIGLMNFINIMETGKDLRGKDYQDLRKMGEKCRLVIIPCGNPDGLERFKPKSLQGMEFEDLRFWGQGTWSNDTFCGWPESKRQHPMKGKNCGFLGCYFNDDGINPMHDEFFAPMSAEVPAILDLARDEAPDMIVSLHSHHVAPAPVCPTYVPQEIKQEIEQLAVNYAAIMKRYDIPTFPFKYAYEKGEIPPTYNLISALYHVSGAKPFAFECPQGIIHADVKEFSMEDILEMQLGLYEAMMDYALK